MQRELVFHLSCGILVSCIDVEDIAVHFVEPDSSEEPIEPFCTDDQRHSGGNRLLLDLRNNHSSAKLERSLRSTAIATSGPLLGLEKLWQGRHPRAWSIDRLIGRGVIFVNLPPADEDANAAGDY
ncbi:hypothetical protein [Bradyrhizobium zhanjiangense]|uniref:hypothetical protein n=1 Tax=Bradyrhizobium zhanjiangense TaxID=1325107 RepID=UPI0013E89F21|nr:hypothetical protein [Bradyrhizobium zhanjiangense]